MHVPLYPRHVANCRQLDYIDFILLTVHHLSSKRLIALVEFRIWILEHAEMSAISVTPRPSLTLSVLDAYFSDISDMMTYLAERLELVDSANSISDHLLRDGDSPSYRAFISTTYIASKPSAADNGGKRLFKAYHPMMYMREASSPNSY